MQKKLTILILILSALLTTLKAENLCSNLQNQPTIEKSDIISLATQKGGRTGDDSDDPIDNDLDFDNYK
ncbi:MAG: hypothetical protein CR982_07585 [Candidatus Cloacimonadota bacterium]|nr:MAG: hypothetical protein CR982_07585 [Candidatus Cloacimonadota bacterium]